MAILIRIDVDRPYGRTPLYRHIASRIGSDLYFPVIKSLGYLEELKQILGLLAAHKAHAYIFFRRCTLPQKELVTEIRDAGHTFGLHLEDSRSFETFLREKQTLEAHLGLRLTAVSKHGSGGRKYGFHHHAPYELEKYIEWASRSEINLLLGNGEDPTTAPLVTERGLKVYPAAFWLEPSWRDTQEFSISWLIERAKRNDIVVLIHPENILVDKQLTSDFIRILESCEVRSGT